MVERRATLGLLAHVVEEIKFGAPHRFLPDEQIVYTDMASQGKSGVAK